MCFEAAAQCRSCFVSCAHVVSQRQVLFRFRGCFSLNQKYNDLWELTTVLMDVVKSAIKAYSRPESPYPFKATREATREARKCSILAGEKWTKCKGKDFAAQ